jgi:5-methyltetrahydrofolate corrinoid/iron sulfur protein methyltransferase
LLYGFYLIQHLNLKREQTMLLIGENLNVISTIIGKAFKEKDPGPIAEEAKRQKEKAMDWIDINLGPARKGGPELMEFIVKTVQETIGDTPPLCLDTSNIEAMERQIQGQYDCTDVGAGRAAQG